MNKNRTNNWTQIEIPGDDTGADTTAFELNLEGDEPNETTTINKPNESDEEVLDVREESKDHRRQVVTVSTNQKDKNSQTRTEDDEDQEERAVPSRQTRQTQVNDDDEDQENSKRNSRAHKRIQTLHARATTAEAEIARSRAENLALRKQLAATQRKAAETSRDSFKSQLDSAEQELEAAVQSNDASRIAKATRQVSALTLKHEAMTAVTEEPEEEIVEEAPIQPQQDLTAAKSWLGRNPQFRTDRTFHVNVRLITDDLTKEGTLDPQDEEYWQELDKRLHKTLRIEQEPTRQEPQRRRQSPVGSRNDEDSEDFRVIQGQFKRQGNRVQVTPTADDYEIAEKFNIPIKDLMAEKYKYAQVGNKGYVQIDIPGQNTR